MRDASTYPITTGYGYVAGYPLNNGFHKGQDRAMPTGTSVLVNGVQVGLSGSTGASTGPHLHIGRYVNGAATNPAGGGFSIAGAVVLDTGFDNINGNYVRVTDGGNGSVWVYLHLSTIRVVKGQPLKGGEPMLNEGDIKNIWRALYDKEPTAAEIAAYNGKSFKELVYNTAIPRVNEFKRKITELSQDNVPPILLGPGNYKVVK